MKTTTDGLALRNAPASPALVTTKLKTTALLNEGDETQKQVDSYLLMNISNQESTGSTAAHSTHTERSLKQNKMLGNITGECVQLLSLL